MGLIPSLVGLAATVGVILVVVFVYVASMAWIEMVLTLVDIERNTAGHSGDEAKKGRYGPEGATSRFVEAPVRADADGRETGPYAPSKT